MRLKSEIWVHAYIRRCAAENVPAAVVHHGDDDAGAIYVKINRLDGTAALYGPVPAGFSSDRGDRKFTEHQRPGTSDDDIERYLARQRDFDRDLWLVEVEDRKGRHFLDDWI
jgi:hypothetical protein